VTDELASGRAVSAIVAAMHWAYDHAKSAIPGIGSAEDLAESHLTRCGGSRERAVDSIVAWQVGYAGAAGFVSNLGGVMTLPVAIPANLASVLLIQLRMIAAIAHVRGYKISDERVRTLAFLCLAGSGAANIMEEFSVKLGTTLTSRLIMRIPAAALTRINQAVGFRLVTRAGAAGLVNLTKIVPFIGGIVGGGFDAVVTRGIATVAKETFRLLPEEARVN
jgi:hypothetical protein